MANRMGNPGNKGNPNAKGRPSVKEVEWHLNLWNINGDIRKLRNKIKTGMFAARDVYALGVYEGDRALLKNLADKVLADLHSIRGVVGTVPVKLTEEEQTEVKKLFIDASDNEETDTLAE